MKSSVFMKVIVLAIFATMITPSSFSETKKKNSNKNKQAVFVIYMNENKTDTYNDITCLTTIEGENSGMTSYSVDRYEGTKKSLMAMEFGSYLIEGSKITFKAGKYNFVGELMEDKIVIDGKEYIKQPTQASNK
jgi:hypothetical protein